MMGDLLDHTGSGAFEVPAAAARALERIEKLCFQSKPFNAVELRRELNETLWWGTESGSPEEEEQARQRVHALGWALQELAVWTPEPPHALYRLQIVLTTLLMSLPSDREAMEIAPQQMARLPLLDGLEMLLKLTCTGIQSHRHHLGEHQWQEETLAAGYYGDYSKLRNLIRHLEMKLPPDVHLTVMLLSRFAPERLARLIEERQDVFFSVAVRDALTEDAPKFALSVNDVTFKFVCASLLADARVANAPEGSVEIIRELLLQVAQTDLWRSWLLDFARYPHADTVTEKALFEALAQLTAAHWSAFVDAVELWTHAETAGAVAKILVPFLHALGNEKSADMWCLAFERWNKWDYGRDEKNKRLLAPSACSFDFPVAMHYALIPLDEALAEEARLLEDIATVEQKWFTDLLELVTYRNRLSSRLRLVQHGLAIRNPPPESEGVYALPPCIEPDSEFAKVRYRFFDVNASRRNGR
jgi:hypothetical protein